MMSLKFKNTNLAIQHLADITGKRVFIAAKPLKDMFPILIKRYRETTGDQNIDDDKIKDIILDVAMLDPKYKHNENKPHKLINILFEWYLDNKRILSSINREEISEYLRKYANLKGKGKAKKELKQFKTFHEFIDYMEDLKEKIKEEEDADIKKNFLENEVELSLNGINAYYIDGSWEEIGRALFEDQSKWCVNREQNYYHYEPLWLFTKENSYYALLSPRANEFHNKTNDPLEIEESDELMPLLDRLGLKDEWEDSDAGENYKENEPPYELEEQYIDSYFYSVGYRMYKEELENKFEEKIENYNFIEKDALEDITDIPKDDLFFMFIDVYHEENLEIEWEYFGGGNWEIEIDMIEAAHKTPFENLLYNMAGPIEKAAMKNEGWTEDLSQKLKKLNKNQIELLKERYPKYFNNIAEQKGQKKLFSSVYEAIQHLADITGKRIIIN